MIKIILNDPVKKCELYKKEGCSHVDGILCDYPKCSMLEAFRKENLICPVCGYYCLGKGGIGCIDKPSLIKNKPHKKG